MYNSLHAEEEHITFLFRALHSLASNWHGFCLQLDVEELDQIENNGTQVDDRLVLGLQAWLRGVDINWKQLIAAIYQPAGGANARLASRVALSFRGINFYGTLITSLLHM